MKRIIISIKTNDGEVTISQNEREAPIIEGKGAIRFDQEKLFFALDKANEAVREG